MSDKMTDKQFAGKVDWEGGVFPALEYGLKAEDLEDQEGELAVAWRRLQELFEPVEGQAVYIDGLLEEIGYEDDDE